jgi:hypothetical protein
MRKGHNSAAPPDERRSIRFRVRSYQSLFSVPKREAQRVYDAVADSFFEHIRIVSVARIEGERRKNRVKRAILATVVNVEKKCSDSVLMQLESDELSKTTEVVSTGLNGEQSLTNRESIVEVICEGDPRAKAGDKVPIIINLMVS